MTDHNTAYRGDFDTQPEEDDPLAELARIVSGDVPANSSNPNVGSAGASGSRTAPQPVQPVAEPQDDAGDDGIGNLDFAAALAEELDPAAPASREEIAKPQAEPEIAPAAAGPVGAALSLEDQLLAEMGQGAEPQSPPQPVAAQPVPVPPASEPVVKMSRATPRPVDTPSQSAAAPGAPSDADAALARLEAVAQSLTDDPSLAVEKTDSTSATRTGEAAANTGNQPQALQGMAVGNTLIDREAAPQDGFADAEADLEAGFAEVFAEELGLEEVDATSEQIADEAIVKAGDAGVEDAGEAIENQFADAFARELAIGTDEPQQEMPASHAAEDFTHDPGAFPGGFQDDDFAFEPAAEDGALPAARAANQSAGTNRGFRLAIGALVVALLVGTGVVAWGTFGTSQPGEGGEPPVIRADAEPAKVKPDDPGGKVIANQENQVYDRVAGGQGEENNTQEELITSREQPVDVAEKTASRLSPDAGGDATASPLGLPPKKVRTLVVKPDGTIVSNSEPVIAQDGQSGGEPLPLSPQPQTLAMAQTGEASNSAAEAAEETAQSQDAEEPSVIALDGAKSTGELATPTPSPLPAPQPQAAAAPAPKPAAPKPAAAQPAAESDAGAPTQIAAVTESTQQTAAARPAVTSSEWKVQVSSQRSRDAAESSFANIKQRFSSILGGRSAAIERADIDGKGTFYRVKVLAESKSDATNTCNRLKGAGGSCFVTR